MSRLDYYGVGVNDADWPIYFYDVVDGKKKRVGICPFYMRWVNILSRCYSPKQLN